MNGLIVLAALLGNQDVATTTQPTVVIVIGAAGAPEYGEQFAKWSKRWETAARRGDAKLIVIGRDKDPAKTDRDRLHEVLRAEPHTGSNELWLVLIGHGTYDGRAARFNLRGPDVAATQLEEWLTAQERPTAVINCASSSAPFVNRLSGEGRIIITATKSGAEQNYARFGDYLSTAIIDPAADLDKDGQTSLFEAFLSASRQTGAFYKQEGRLDTEHALIDDNADGLGTRAEWYRGLRTTRKPEGSTADGHRAHQWHLVPSEYERSIPSELRKKRDELELAVIRLRESKAAHTEEDYGAKLEAVLLDLARLYERIDDVTGRRVAGD